MLQPKRYKKIMRHYIHGQVRKATDEVGFEKS